MATMKSNNAAIAAMQQMLQERCIAEPTFAIKMANPSKSMEGAVNYLCGQIQKSGLCCVDDATVMNILVEILNTLANVFDIQWVTNYIFNRSNKLPTAWVFYRHCSELMGTLPIAG